MATSGDFCVATDMMTAHEEAKTHGGRRSRLSREDQVLLTLEFWREYRTHFHQGQSWGIHESTAWRIVRKVEDLLVSSGRFALPGTKGVREDVYEIVAVDVAETPIERPKKATCLLQWEEKAAHPKGPGHRARTPGPRRTHGERTRA